MKKLGGGSETEIVVIGGGLAGLAAAATAEQAGATTVVLEAAPEPGGLARSFHVDGYTFDCSGHLLHLARPETESLVYSVTSKDDWVELERCSSIVIRNRLVPYPFQLHLAHAPEDIRDECLSELPKRSPDLGDDPAELGFDEWINASLGTGIGRHFMIPYNEKVSQAKVSDLTCEWLGRFVPKPSLDDIRSGASSKRQVETGYNAHFLYPRAGGIQALWRGLAARVADVRTGTRVVEIDTDRCVVRVASGEKFAYSEGVISSSKLPAMTRLVQPVPSTQALAGLLRGSTITCVNVGVRNLSSRFADLTWLYLPESRFRAYRIGFYNRFSAEMSPPGGEGLYVEIAHGPGVSEQALIDAAVADLVELGAIESDEDVEVAAPVRLNDAYVVHDRNCSWARGRILDDLSRRGIRMVGRYGNWEYAAMEDALWQGIAAANELTGSASKRIELTS